MNQATVTALNQLNQDFYNSIAQSFSSTRHYAWHSWDRFVEVSPILAQQNTSFLDLGCGNGRFGQWLLERGYILNYTGLDSNAQLLAEAQEALPQETFIQKDMVQSLLDDQSFIEGQFDGITVFGVLHHIPSFALRKKLFTQLATRLKTKGEIWLTAWQPQGRFLEWPSVCERFGIQADQLEDGDQFLGWKDTDAVRYVHTLLPGEMENLLSDTDLHIVKYWSEENRGERGNRCFLLRRQK
jgi:2-polyprenyl-3-methyl-5-hydroxy-6-metoxy-1,4-benzoquinol methylase